MHEHKICLGWSLGTMVQVHCGSLQFWRRSDPAKPLSRWIEPSLHRFQNRYSRAMQDLREHAVFATTHWSVVLAAASRPECQEPWEELCRGYWYPLYAFIRRDGYTPHDAQDLTQEFLSRLVHRRQLDGIQAGRGKFRSFLLVTLKHFLSDDRKRSGAKKRGGDYVLVSFDEQLAESRFQNEPLGTHPPESLFDRQWGLELLHRVRDRLRRRYAERGRNALFQHLEPCLGDSERPQSYAEIATALGMDEGTIKVSVHRLRKEFGAELRAEVARTVSDPNEIDAEIRELIAVASG
jgi:RNA polymerase sigma factor (sigma-70 family)